jgi:hypothetical protein
MTILFLLHLTVAHNRTGSLSAGSTSSASSMPGMARDSDCESTDGDDDADDAACAVAAVPHCSSAHPPHLVVGSVVWQTPSGGGPEGVHGPWRLESMYYLTGEVGKSSVAAPHFALLQHTSLDFGCNQASSPTHETHSPPQTHTLITELVWDVGPSDLLNLGFATSGCPDTVGPVTIDDNEPAASGISQPSTSLPRPRLTLPAATPLIASPVFIVPSAPQGVLLGDEAGPMATAWCDGAPFRACD